MPQSNLPPLPPGFTLDTPTATPAPNALGRPIVRKGATPEKPRKQIVGDQIVDLETGTATPVPGLEKDHWRELTPADGKLYLGDRPGLMNTRTGDVKYGPGPEKAGANTEQKQRETAQALIKAAGVDLAGGVDPVSDLIKGSTSGRIQHFGADAYGAVTGSATSGMENISKLKTIVSDLTLQLTGGGLGNQISDADRKFIIERVGNLADPDVPANARLAAWEQVKQRMGNVLGVKVAPLKEDAPEDKQSDLTLADLVAGKDKPQEAPPQPNMTAATGEYRSVIDPKAQAFGNKIIGLLNKGASRNTILGYAVRVDPTLRGDGRFMNRVDELLRIREKNPKARFSVDPGFYTKQVPLSEEGVIPGASLLSEKDRAQAAASPVGAALSHAGDAVTAGNLANIAGFVGGDPNAVEKALAAQTQIHPAASMAGDVGGGVLAAMAGEAALARAGMNPGLLRGLTADATYGGVSGGSNSDSDNVLGKLGDALKGAGMAGAGSLVGQGLLKIPGKALEGVSNPTVGYVAREVPDALTVGQMVGQSGRVGAAVKGIEDRLSGLPVIGDTVNARRIEGIQKMNSKAFDKALEPIGENVAGSYGEDAVSLAQQKVSAAFQKALGGKTASVDRQFMVAATKAKMGIDKLPPSVAPDVQNLIDSAVNDYVDPATLSISGDNVQALLQELEGIKSSYYSQKHPAAKRIGSAVDNMIDAVEGMFERQHPGSAAQYDAAKKSFRRLATLESAVNAAKNTSKDGNALFSPAQLGVADRANTIKYGGKHKAAAGGGEFHDFQRAMQEVLPNKVPDSGTAGRLIVPAALLGAGAGADYGGAGGKGLTLATLLTLAYSRKGQQFLRAATRPGGARAAAAGRKLQTGGRALGSVGATQAALGTSRDQ